MIACTSRVVIGQVPLQFSRNSLHGRVDGGVQRATAAWLFRGLLSHPRVHSCKARIFAASLAQEIVEVTSDVGAVSVAADLASRLACSLPLIPVCPSAHDTCTDKSSEHQRIKSMYLRKMMESD